MSSLAGVPRGGRQALLILVAVVVALLVAVSAAAAAGRARVAVAVPAGVPVGHAVVVAGRVSPAKSGARVLAQQRVRGRWVTRATGRVRLGAFVVHWRAPGKPGSVSVRVELLRGRRVVAVSGARRVAVLAKGGASGARVVLLPASVAAVPAPGSAGVVRVHGPLAAQPGDILAAGVGPSSPDGFLGQVTGVRQQGADALVSTQPATLPQAVPNGSIDQTVNAQPLSSDSASAPRGLRAHVRSALNCGANGVVKVEGSVSLTPSVTLKAHWSLWHGVDSASLTGSATASTQLKATAAGAASCTVGPVAIATWRLAPVEFTVGPIPVVLVPKVTVDLGADGSVKAAVTSDLHASFTASAGVAWTKDGGFSPVSGFSHNLGFDPPTPTDSAHLGAAITPTVDVLLYGVAGPQVAFGAGLSLDASTTANPWWTLTAPTDLTAQLAAPALGLHSGLLHVYRHTFTVATASGPFGAGGTGTSGGGGGGGAGTPGSGGSSGGEMTSPLGSIQEFAVPTADAGPNGITAGPDGAVWFTEHGGKNIGRVAADGAVSEYPLPTTSEDLGIAAGPDGALWYAAHIDRKIGRVMPDGSVTQYAVPSAYPHGITAGPDGALWFTEDGENYIGRVTTDGTMTEYPVPSSYYLRAGGNITSGPDGALWFTERSADNIGRITTNGTVTEYALPTSGASPDGITAGPDGALWFTERTANKIGRITTDGNVTEYDLPTADGGPEGITKGSDGVLWFTEGAGNRIGRITVGGSISEKALPTDAANPDGITVGPDRALWFAEPTSNQIGRIAR